MPKGVSMLIMVLLIGSACLALALGSVWLGVGERELSQVWSGGDEARLVAESCVENALERLKIDSAYEGETLSLGQKSCIITIAKTGQPMSSALIAVFGTSGDYTKKINLSLEVVDESFKITSWQEN